MKNRITAVGLTIALLLPMGGCASMLERSYQATNPHADRPTTAEDPSVLRVENYRELVSAVLYLVSQGEEEGAIQLHDYAGEVETDLRAACLEVTTEDPLGAYAVDYIKHEYTRVVSDYQAALSIHYRRSQEQVRSMVKVTGTGAIRTELQEALGRFATEVVLRVAYFSEDQDSINQLIRQAYYDTPGAALGCPEAEITLYPDSGRERVVEILLTYPENTEELRRKSEELSGILAGRAYDSMAPDLENAAHSILEELLETAGYDGEGGATVYDALVEGRANSEGLALAYALLCRQEEELTCEVVEGTLLDGPRFWDQLQFPDGEVRYLDPAEGGGTLYDAQELYEAGYRWADGPRETPTAEEE